jgi:plasmid stabilization system protein ParE
MDYKLRWSAESVKNLEEIIEYLQNKWTAKDVNKFKNKLSKHLELILQFPFLFLSSLNYPTLRKSVMSKQTTVFYKIQDNHIFIAFIHVNKKQLNL